LIFIPSATFYHFHSSLYFCFSLFHLFECSLSIYLLFFIPCASFSYIYFSISLLFLCPFSWCSSLVFHPPDSFSYFHSSHCFCFFLVPLWLELLPLHVCFLVTWHLLKVRMLSVQHGVQFWALISPVMRLYFKLKAGKSASIRLMTSHQGSLNRGVNDVAKPTTSLFYFTLRPRK
jgi:hypothetical protein